MLTAINSKKELVNVQATDEGEILVKISQDAENKPSEVEVKNIPTTENGNVKVEIVNEVETTLKAEIITIGTEVTEIEVGKKVTELSIANYSEKANITININGENINIGSNLAIDLPINKTITNISFSSTEENTKIQYVIKGVE